MTIIQSRTVGGLMLRVRDGAAGVDFLREDIGPHANGEGGKVPIGWPVNEA
jgi:hypothetical protein